MDAHFRFAEYVSEVGHGVRVVCIHTREGAELAVVAIEFAVGSEKEVGRWPESVRRPRRYSPVVCALDRRFRDVVTDL